MRRHTGQVLKGYNEMDEEQIKKHLQQWDLVSSAIVSLKAAETVKVHLTADEAKALHEYINFLELTRQDWLAVTDMLEDGLEVVKKHMEGLSGD